MIRKSGNRFSDKIMRQENSHDPESGNRFFDKIMRQENSHDPKKWEPVFRQDHAPENKQIIGEGLWFDLIR